MTERYMPEYLIDMARYSRNCFHYLTQRCFAKAIRREDHTINASEDHLLNRSARVVSTDRSLQNPPELSITLNASLIDLFKQSEVALRQLQLAKHRQEKSDVDSREAINDRLQCDQSAYHELQDRFHKAFLETLANANLLDATQIEETPLPTVGEEQEIGVESPRRADREMPTTGISPVDTDETQDNEISEQDGFNEYFTNMVARNEEYRKAIKETKARMIQIKENLDIYSKDETYMEKVREYELSVESGNCTISRNEFDMSYANRIHEWEREEAEAEEEFWQAIADAEAQGMVVDAYVKDLQQDEDSQSLAQETDGGNLEAHELFVNAEAFEAFKRRAGAWVENVPTIGETEDGLPSPYQPDPLYPNDNVIDRDIVGANSGVLFGRPR